MPSMFSRLSRSKSTISSSRFRNSGRKCARTAAITWSRAASAFAPSGSVDSAWLPRFEVRMISVFLKSTTLPLPVGQPPVVEHLQQHVEHVRMRLLDLVEQDHLVGPPPHRLGQHPALVVADIARRRADQPGDRVLLHELAHVDAHHRLVVVEQERRQRLGQLGLADAGRPEEQERPQRPVRVVQPRPRPPHRVRHRLDRLLLADDPLARAPPPCAAACRARPRASGRPGCRSSARRPAAICSGVTASSTIASPPRASASSSSLLEPGHARRRRARPPARGCPAAWRSRARSAPGRAAP